MATNIISLNGYPLADSQARASVTALETRADALEQADSQMGASVTALGSRVDALEQTGGSGGAAIDDAATAESSTWSSSKIAQEVESRLAQETFDRVFYISEPSVNLYEPRTEGWTDNAMIYSSGVVTVDESTCTKYCVTPDIPIEAEKTYTFTPVNGPASLADKNRLRTYTQAGSPLGVITLTKNEDGSATFTTPAGSATIRFTIFKSDFASDYTKVDEAISAFNGQFMLVEGTSAPESYIPYIPAQNTLRNIEIPEGSVKLSKIGDDARPLLLPLAGRSIANFGDSIFGNARPPQDISTFLAEKTGATVYNCAFGGCRMGPHNTGWDSFSMYRLADAIVSGDYSLQDTAMEGSARPSYGAEPLALIKSIDFSALDILTIAYGTNDFTGANPIDNADDPLDTSTVCGALRYSLGTLLTTFPQLHIFVLLPTYRFAMDDDGNFTEDSSTMTNSLGKTLPEYVQAMAEAARAYGVPVVDNYHELGVNRWSRAQYFSGSDGVHLNEAGRRLMAAKLARVLW